MAAKSDTAENGGTSGRNERYEYRVWGKHRKARRKLEDMATGQAQREDIEDCYLLVDDDDWNGKVRNSRLKVKRRLGEKRGFEKWDSNWHAKAKATPSPFDDVFREMRLDRPQKGKRFDIDRAAARLDDDSAARAVFVTKRRRRYEVGDITAEITRLDLRDSGARMHTIAFQGSSRKDLKKLLKKLGLDGLPNVPMHVAIARETDEEVTEDG